MKRKNSGTDNLLLSTDAWDNLSAQQLLHNTEREVPHAHPPVEQPERSPAAQRGVHFCRTCNTDIRPQNLSLHSTHDLSIYLDDPRK